MRGEVPQSTIIFVNQLSRTRSALHTCIHAAGQSARNVGRRYCIFVILAAVSLASVSVLGRLGFNFMEALTANERENPQAGTKS